MSEVSSPPYATDSVAGGRPAQAVPNNREAEEAVLGAILVNPEVYFDVAQRLAPDDYLVLESRA